MTTANIAAACILDALAASQTVEALIGHAWHVLSDAELLAYHKGLLFPCMGIVYDGITPVQKPRDPAPQAGSVGGGGVSSVLRCTFIILDRANTLLLEDTKNSTTLVVDSVRSAMLRRKSPTGHVWRFQLEVAVPSAKGTAGYIQRWETAIPLV